MYSMLSSARRVASWARASLLSPWPLLTLPGPRPHTLPPGDAATRFAVGGHSHWCRGPPGPCAATWGPRAAVQGGLATRSHVFTVTNHMTVTVDLPLPHAPESLGKGIAGGGGVWGSRGRVVH